MRRAILLVLVLALVASTANAGVPARLPETRSGQVPVARVAAYWSPARLAQAKPRPLRAMAAPDLFRTDASSARAVSAMPAGVEPTQPPGRPAPAPRSGAPASSASVEVSGDLTRYPLSTHGKVFFTDPLNGGDYVCSGTVVSSPARNLVVTAGHCVHDAGEWMTNWAFVPAYEDGDSPLGIWPASELFTTSGWATNGSFRADVGAATVAAGPGGTRLSDMTGARGMRWGGAADVKYRAFGYPAEWPFTGEVMRSCTNRAAGRDGSSSGAPIALDCDMSGGSSGGGWVAGDSYVQSVTSYGYDDEPGVLYGPYFSDQVAALYRAAAGTAGSPMPGELLTGVAARPNPFSPNGDGRRDVTRIHFSLSRAAKVTVIMKDQTGARVRVLGRAESREAGDHMRAWNGRNAAGRRLSVGVYRYVVKAGTARVRGRVKLTNRA